MKSLIVCGENYVNKDAVLTASNGQATAANVWDQNQATQWSDGGVAEGVAVTFLIEFYDRTGAAVSRSIDRLILLNCNWAQFYAEYWNGSAWVQIAESVFNGGAPNAAASVYIEKATPVTTQKIRWTVTNTIGAVGNRLAGEIKVCLFKVLCRHLVGLDRADWDDGGDFRLLAGGLVTFRNVSKFEGSVSIQMMTLATYEILKDLVRFKSWMTWVLYQDFRLADVYEVAATTPLAEKLDRKLYLYDMSFTVKER